MYQSARKVDLTEIRQDWQSRLERGLRDPAPSVLRCYSEVSSTMHAAKEVAGQVAPGQFGLIISERQSAGQGRQARSWRTADGAFAGTYLLATAAPLSRLSGFSLAVGCALHDVLKAQGCDVGLKWPNDVLSLDRRKMSGILVQSSTQNGYISLAVGIGVNLTSTPNDLSSSTSMYELSGLRFDPVDFVTAFTPKLLEDWALFQQKGFAAFKDRWQSAALFSGEQLRFQLESGIVEGRMCGVSESGSLLLDVQGEIKELSAGDIIAAEGGYRLRGE